MDGKLIHEITALFSLIDHLAYSDGKCELISRTEPILSIPEQVAPLQRGDYSAIGVDPAPSAILPTASSRFRSSMAYRAPSDQPPVISPQSKSSAPYPLALLSDYGTQSTRHPCPTQFWHPLGRLWCSIHQRDLSNAGAIPRGGVASSAVYSVSRSSVDQVRKLAGCWQKRFVRCTNAHVLNTRVKNDRRLFV